MYEGEGVYGEWEGRQVGGKVEEELARLKKVHIRYKYARV